jgi:hypothetical protein
MIIEMALGGMPITILLKVGSVSAFQCVWHRISESDIAEIKRTPFKQTAMALFRSRQLQILEISEGPSNDKF